MPKVSEKYIYNKRQAIADAAYQVCLRKPVSSVTMQDIINETGLSQGGIYRFYSDLDEILQAMISNMRKQFGIISDTDKFFEEKKEKTASEFARQICSLLADRMEQNLMTIQKINYDLTVLAINEPERVKKILRNIDSESNMEHLTKCTFELIMKRINEGDLHLKVEPEILMQYIACAYTGIEHNCIISNCYDAGPMNIKYSPRPLLETLGITIAYLLGEN